MTEGSVSGKTIAFPRPRRQRACRIIRPELRKLGPKMRKCEREALFMKATGIVRRIDELGRVVIPKEIRRTLRIREGDPSQTTFATRVLWINQVLERFSK